MLLVHPLMYACAERDLESALQDVEQRAAALLHLHRQVLLCHFTAIRSTLGQTRSKLANPVELRRIFDSVC